ncbi:MAG TPA: hypothetical protein VH044_20795, partial [Polyangiaceae bacterium]|nr:hypothetical protein [Polyangiaceae bacterium]
MQPTVCTQSGRTDSGAAEIALALGAFVGVGYVARGVVGLAVGALGAASLEGPSSVAGRAPAQATRRPADASSIRQNPRAPMRAWSQPIDEAPNRRNARRFAMEASADDGHMAPLPREPSAAQRGEIDVKVNGASRLLGHALAAVDDDSEAVEELPAAEGRRVLAALGAFEEDCRGPAIARGRRMSTPKLEAYVTRARLLHVIHALSGLHWPNASYFIFEGDPARGRSYVDDTCGNHFAVGWGEAGIVACGWEHEYVHLEDVGPEIVEG